jgi:NADH:ubiquinone oxidoreductase subunit K
MLSANFGFLIFSIVIDDLYGEVFSLFILAVTGAESTVGLAIIILFFRVRNTIFGTQNILLKR